MTPKRNVQAISDEAESDVLAHLPAGLSESDYTLTPAQIEELEQIVRDIDEGRMGFASDEEVEAMWDELIG